jgi:hypothetical protein
MDSPLRAPGGLGGSLLVQLCIAGAQLALHGFRQNPLFDRTPTGSPPLHPPFSLVMHAQQLSLRICTVALQTRSSAAHQLRVCSVAPLKGLPELISRQRVQPGRVQVMLGSTQCCCPTAWHDKNRSAAAGRNLSSGTHWQQPYLYNKSYSSP